MEEGKSEIAEEWVTGKQKKVRVLITIVIIAIVLIMSYFVFSMDNHPTSPEALINEWMERVNNGDVNGAFELTTIRFTDNFDYYVSNANWMYDVQFSVSDIFVRYSPDMNISEITSMEDHVNQTEDVCNVLIEDYCLLNYKRIAQWSTGEIEDVEGQTGCFKIDSKWYLHVPTY